MMYTETNEWETQQPKNIAALKKEVETLQVKLSEALSLYTDVIATLYNSDHTNIKTHITDAFHKSIHNRSDVDALLKEKIILPPFATYK